MSKKKLTLTVEEEALRKARWFSKKHRTSISRLVSDFLSTLEDPESLGTPIIGRIRGVLNPAVSLEDYHDHIAEKYAR